MSVLKPAGIYRDRSKDFELMFTARNSRLHETNSFSHIRASKGSAATFPISTLKQFSVLKVKGC